MGKFVWAYLAAALFFVAADFVWLGFVARGFYKEQLGALMSEHPSMPVAVAFYALYLVGVVVFGVTPGIRDSSWPQALLFGALFGFFAYATYDLTNLATVRGWPSNLAYVDLAWGTVLTGLAALCGYGAAAWAG